ncbi:MAG: histidinol-phosphate transaminase [Armatimonadetes bacterium]|nr:histidinol-phosphate transaminase [Armatimonadota bacterium]MBS1726468.1 histidinol-phosphate transaminase [Armatimonadota bacterium]
MSDLHVRPNVLKMTPYSPGKPIEEVKRELGLTRVIKLASNENPLGPSPKAVAAIKEAADQIHLYPDGSAFLLRQALSEHYSLPISQIIVGNGSDELIHLLGQIFLGSPEDEVIVGYPSFVRYDASAGLADCQLVRVPLTEDMRLDLAAMAAAVTDHTRLVFIANPNNPTGTIVTSDELDRFLAAISSDVVVVLDEAYFEFADDTPGYPNSLDYINRYPNVVGMRTFSKTYGLAGIRVGYAFVSDTISDAIDRAREPFNVNLIGQVAAKAALGDRDHLQKTVELNRQGLERMEKAFLELGAKPFKSYANFIMADLGQPARPVFQALLERGVITRSGDVLGMPNCLRVSVGNAEEVQIFVEELTKVLG